MTFLDPWFLIGLPAAALPLILHLLRRRRRDVIDWGAYQFLLDSVAEGKQKSRVDEWILLALRMLLLALLAVSLSRPVTRRSDTSLPPERDVVVIVDNSLSTSARQDRETVWSHLHRRSVEILTGLTAGDQVRVLLTAAPSPWLDDRPVRPGTEDYDRLLAALAEVEPTRGADDVANALQLACDPIPQEVGGMRQVYVVCDACRRSWFAEPRTSAPAGPPRLPVLADEARIDIDFVDGQPDATLNRAITQLEAAPQVQLPNEEIQFVANISQFGRVTSDQSIPLSAIWTIDGKEMAATRLLASPPGADLQTQWQYAFQDEGFFRVECHIAPDDVLPEDNHEAVIVEVRRQRPILVVRSDLKSAEAEHGAHYLGAALGHRDAAIDGAIGGANGGADRGVNDGAWRSIYRPQRVTSNDMPQLALSDYDAVILTDQMNLPETEMERLTTYVQDGGGLWICLNDEVDVHAFNTQWYNEGTGLAPCRIQQIVEHGVEELARRDPQVRPSTDAHAATMTLANPQGGHDLDQVRVRRRFQFEVDELRPWTPLLATSRGEPLVITSHFGTGRVLVQSFPLGLEWSNFPLTRAYVIAVQDYLSYLTGPAGVACNLEPGQPIHWHLPPGNQPVTAVVRGPTGRIWNRSFDSVRGGDAVDYGATHVPGRYDLELQGYNRVRIPFQVRREIQESDLTPLEEEERMQIQSSLRAAGSLAVERAGSRGDRPLYGRRPLWSACLLALLGLVGCECVFANRLSRARYGAS